MFLRSKIRRKDGKTYRYWSIVENRRVRGKRVVQRHALYLGEIKNSQQAAWCKTIKVFKGTEVEAESTGFYSVCSVLISGGNGLAEYSPADSHYIVLSRYTHHEKGQQILLQQLKLDFPTQPPPKISSNHVQIK